MKRCLRTDSEENTINVGAEFSKMLNAGDVVAFYGELGTGKTRFIKGVCQGLGVREHVSSPTFTIVNEYTGSDVKIFHFDFYRLRTTLELQEIGFDEYLNDDGVCLIEWADRVRAFLPLNRIDIFLNLGKKENEREIIIEQIKETVE